MPGQEATPANPRLRDDQQAIDVNDVFSLRRWGAYTNATAQHSGESMLRPGILVFGAS